MKLAGTGGPKGSGDMAFRDYEVLLYAPRRRQCLRSCYTEQRQLVENELRVLACMHKCSSRATRTTNRSCTRPVDRPFHLAFRPP